MSMNRTGIEKTRTEIEDQRISLISTSADREKSSFSRKFVARYATAPEECLNHDRNSQCFSPPPPLLSITLCYKQREAHIFHLRNKEFSIFFHASPRPRSLYRTMKFFLSRSPYTRIYTYITNRSIKCKYTLTIILSKFIYTYTSLYVYARNEFVIDAGLIVILFDLDNAQFRHRLASLPACYYGKFHRGRYTKYNRYTRERERERERD